MNSERERESRHNKAEVRGSNPVRAAHFPKNSTAHGNHHFTYLFTTRSCSRSSVEIENKALRIKTFNAFYDLAVLFVGDNRYFRYEWSVGISASDNPEGIFDETTERVWHDAGINKQWVFTFPRGEFYVNEMVRSLLV